MSRVAGTDFTAQFFAQANKHIGTEQTPSLATVQGLYTLFLASTFIGSNRTANEYRVAAFDMLHKLRLDAAFARLDPNIPKGAERTQAISRTCWGMFTSEGCAYPVFL